MKDGNITGIQKEISAYSIEIRDYEDGDVFDEKEIEIELANEDTVSLRLSRNARNKIYFKLKDIVLDEINRHKST